MGEGTSGFLRSVRACPCRRGSISPAVVLALGLLTIVHPRGAGAVPFDTPFGQAIQSVAEGGWGALNLNRFESVWVPEDQRPQIPSYEDSSKVISAWGSMAWDPNRGDLIFWGGGHANYGGNEVYRWRSSTLEWERASLPSDMVAVSGSRYITGDGVVDPGNGYLFTPISSHTYDSNQFLPIADRFLVFGAAAFNTGGALVTDDGSAATGPYFWDPNRADGGMVGGLTGSQVDPAGHPEVVGGEMWQNRQAIVLDANGRRLGDTAVGLVDSAAAYTQENGRDIVYIAARDLWKYTVNDLGDPAGDTLEMVGRYWEGHDGQGAGAYDPDHNIFVRSSSFAPGQPYTFTFWDLDTPGAFNLNHNFLPQLTAGSFEPMLNGWFSYGLEYDPVRHRFVLWGGDKDVCFLTVPADLVNGVWEMSCDDTPATLDHPDLTEVSIFTGVLGKWTYLPGYDVFAGVVDPVSGDIWIYKPEDWSPEFDIANIAAPGGHSIALFGLGVIALGSRRMRRRGSARRMERGPS